MNKKKWAFLSIIIIGIIIAIIIISNTPTQKTYNTENKYLQVSVGDKVSSTLIYAGYIEDNDIIIFGDWFNKRGNLFVRVIDHSFANFTAYGDNYSLTNIRIDGNTLRCNIVIE